MTQYINKTALVAEIKHHLLFTPEHTNAFIEGEEHAYNKIISFLDTLEVKEVDLEKETTHYLLHEHRSPLNEIMHKTDLKSEMQYHKDIENAFKAGFELGRVVSNKAQKRE